MKFVFLQKRTGDLWLGWFDQIVNGYVLIRPGKIWIYAIELVDKEFENLGEL